MANVRGVTAMAGLALAAMVLSGCATSRNVESEVRSFGGPTPIAAGATYRFERLPSQDPKAQAPLEAAAEKALSAKNLVRDDEKARYTVQVRLDAEVLLPDTMARWASSPFPDRVVLAPDGTVWRQVRRPLMDPLWYRRSLQLVVRDLANGNVAYDTRAVHDSTWTDTPNLVAPLLEAALSDFPNSESKPKTVTVVLPPADTKP
jgi:hypothetical protein